MRFLKRYLNKVDGARTPAIALHRCTDKGIVEQVFKKAVTTCGR